MSHTCLFYSSARPSQVWHLKHTCQVWQDTPVRCNNFCNTCASLVNAINNLPPDLSYVSTLPDITQNPKSYAIFLSIVWVALKKNWFWWVWKEPVVWLDHSRCLKWHPFAFTHACSHVCHYSLNGFIDDALRNRVPSVNELLLQLINVTFRFLCNVR